ncbi:UDP-glucuronosyl/UDP-glucosyltransferase [Lasiodiplodia theobromae]|uniref:UDP-glucuronosyl/UDP-glucosyltransferase n=1 Tax=Lasiodiplodia theobromae TaxID=45133 RepID=UPI0015C31857|nr:UDP-glucuronosyl/UDP-glucosyltransferase [Lasiodiplodia theobromae]KAF4541227.1 UDP-glucuronosyl/UDP-glucosyltransferase [Lasiodiplodia theobromae]
MMAGNRPFFYDFDDYSPSESDTTSTTSSSDYDDEFTQKQHPPEPAVRKRLQRRGTDKSFGKGGAQKCEDSSGDSLGTSARRYSRFSIENKYFKTKGKVSKLDGRLKISVNETANSGWLAKALGSGIRSHLGLMQGEEDEESESNWQGHDGKHEQQVIADSLETTRQKEKLTKGREIVQTAPKQIPKLNIVIIVIGSRGDIQPFLKIGKILKSEHGHRVRIATHPAFKEFVEKDSGLEFFSVGGDPSELMAFMVKNPGLIPSVETVKAGEIGRRRKSMYEMFNGMWRACINTTDDENDQENLKMMGEKHPFIADAIIANPPSFAHVHIAERLGVPLHMMFTFPYTPTTQFPHPLANVKQSNIDESYTNFMSYPLVEMMTWQGLGDLVNKFRVKTLGLEPVSTLWAPGQLYRLKVPYTYLWSPTLIPKPTDWGPEINVAGFTFLDLASTFTPPDALVKFLDAGPPPVYIGFGSIVVDDPDAFTQMIFRAVSLAGVRALVSKGWGGIGGSSSKQQSNSSSSLPDNIFLLDNTPHDWLFPRVACVVHHGGAGTTAIGLKCGRPTMIVPFFGDQPFWGAMVAKARAGAHECVPYRKLTAEKLAEGIRQCLDEEEGEAGRNAARLADSIAAEGDGAENAVSSFHASLPLRVRERQGDGGGEMEHSMRCSVLEDRVAVWQLKEKKHGKRKNGSGDGGEVLKLSPLAAEVLTERGKLEWSDLRLSRTYDWNDFDGPGEPISGVGGAVTGTVVAAAQGVGSVPARAMRSVKKHGQHEKRKWKRAKEKRERIIQEEAARDLPYQDYFAGEPVEATDSSSNTIDSQSQQESRQNDPSSSSLKASPGDEHHHHHRPSPPTRASTTPSNPLPTELWRTAGHGLHQSASALARAPVDLALALAQGFHNAPRLYGDDTVRRPVRITGWRSGLRASRQEFVYGVYDGWTGLWRQPARGWREGRAVGAVKGVGLGVGGVVLKNVSAVVGPVGYCAKGLHREVRRWRGKEDGWVPFVRRVRMMQGRREMRRFGGDEEARREVEERVLRVWDKRFEEANAPSGGAGQKSREKREKKDKGDDKTPMKELERPVPRRRSTLKKRQPPPRRRTGEEVKKPEVELNKEREESASALTSVKVNGVPEAQGKDSMADGLVAPMEEIPGKSSSEGRSDHALVRSGSDTVDFASAKRAGEGNRMINGVEFV